MIAALNYARPTVRMAGFFCGMDVASAHSIYVRCSHDEKRRHEDGAFPVKQQDD